MIVQKFATLRHVKALTFMNPEISYRQAGKSYLNLKNTSSMKNIYLKKTILEIVIRLFLICIG